MNLLILLATSLRCGRTNDGAVSQSAEQSDRTEPRDDGSIAIGNHLARRRFSYDRLTEGVICRFTEAQARAFRLLHAFMHGGGAIRPSCITKSMETLTTDSPISLVFVVCLSEMLLAQRSEPASAGFMGQDTLNRKVRKSSVINQILSVGSSSFQRMKDWCASKTSIRRVIYQLRSSLSAC